MNLIKKHMIGNYFKIAWRSFQKHRVFSFINVFGLSIGIACFLLVALYVLDELSYDRHNVYANRIYRIDHTIKFGDFLYEGTEAPAVMGPAFMKNHPQIEQYVRFKNNGGIVVKKGAENLKEDRVIYADSSLFAVFSLPMIAGDEKTALAAPHSVVITERIAKKYFNAADAVGKTMLLNDNRQYKITGVIKDIPVHSHFNFDFFLPASELPESRDDNWFNNNFQTYLLLKPGVEAGQLKSRLNTTMHAAAGPQFHSILNMSRDEFEKSGNVIGIDLRPLTDIHLRSHLAGELGSNGSIQYVYIFSAIAVFILLIACINFMNLSTAHSSNRAKEVGVRKVFGSRRNSLVMQFLTESLCVSFLSFLLAVGMVLLALPFFNQLADKQISPSALLQPPVAAGILLLMLVVGLLAGSYPAFFLSSFRLIEVFRGKLSAGFKGSSVRNALVVFQFSISVILIAGTVIIFRQLTYIRNKSLGFNKERVLILQHAYALNGHVTAFRDELLQMPGVKNATITGFLPVSGARGERGFSTSPQFDNRNFILMQRWSVDENYIPTLQVNIKSGRNFSAGFRTDSSAVVINEAAAKLLGSGDPVGKMLYQVANLKTGALIGYTVIGIMDNFHFNSLHEQIAPLVLKLEPDNGSIAVRMNTGDMPGLLAQVKDRWRTMAPSQPFSYSFLDQEFGKQYDAEQRTGTIALVFSALAILIACLGLFGLVTYAAEKRGKEIGIRKVLGAAVPDIIGLLSKDFIKLIAVSVCIASPVAWWVMDQWLQDFAYRIAVSWWVFAATGLAVLLIAFLVSVFQTIKAAIANPVKSLRTE